MTVDRIVYDGYSRFAKMPRNQGLQMEEERLAEVQELLGYNNPALAKQLLQRGVNVGELSVNIDLAAAIFGPEQVERFLCSRLIRQDGRIKIERLESSIKNQT